MSFKNNISKGGFERPAFKLTEDDMGTDCAMEYVAALAATSQLYKRAFEKNKWDDQDSYELYWVYFILFFFYS